MTLFVFGESVCAGYTEILSPECIPALSTCSMIPGISMSSPSHTASTSTSLPMMYLSTSIGCSWVCLLMISMNSMISLSEIAICIPCPPRTYEGLTSTGTPIFISSSVNLIAVCPPNCTTAPSGCSRFTIASTSSAVRGSK